MSPRLLAIADEVKNDSIVLDVGTDHAYLPIFLVQNHICPKVIASDISKSALEGAKTNIEKRKINNITLVLSDGLKDIHENYDTLIISGMGSRTIIKILEGQVLPDKIILSSQSDVHLLRSYMNKLGYRLIKEKFVLDGGKYYSIITYHKGKEKLSKSDLLYGKSINKAYYKYLYDKKKEISKKVGLLKKIKLNRELKELEKRL